MKLQIAMETLLVYGAAFAVLTVLIGLFYYYGGFASNTPTLPPGSCIVNRPYGPNSIQYVSLAGTCNNDLPEYVATLKGGGSPFLISDNPAAACTSSDNCVAFASPFGAQKVCSLTLIAWSYDTGSTYVGPYAPAYGVWQSTSQVPTIPALGGVVYLYNSISPQTSAVGIEYNDTMLRFEARTAGSSGQNEFFTKGGFEQQWIMTAITINNGVATAYLNGQAVSAGSPNVGCQYPNTAVIGAWDIGFTGLITNVQVYNSSLSSNDISLLYRDGVGAEPINLQNLVAWWQLNQNANDSSGRGDAGTSNGMSYIGGYPKG